MKLTRETSAVLAWMTMLHGFTVTASCLPQNLPFAPLDPQKWVNPDNMVWSDYKAPPDTKWNDPSRKGSSRNFNIALVTVDYSDMPFAVTGAANSTIFGNPQPVAANIVRERVPGFYRDLLNKPTEMNKGHTLHEYWMEDSAGKFGVDLTAFGAYKMPYKSFEYGIDYFNPNSCPGKSTCDRNLRTDALGAWKKDIGEDKAKSYELVFVLSAGQDESSTWQEFGEMKFMTKKDVSKAFGPPPNSGNYSLGNAANTRYVDWTSWAAAASVWPNAAGGSSLQCESSGMGTYAHELSHLLSISDNYNNPYGKPLRRSYTGPWSMLSRGTFNGPGGPHSRWQIPALQGGSLGSLHTMRDKIQLGLVADERVLKISKSTLAKTGLVTAKITARSVFSDLMGVRIDFGGRDTSPACNTSSNPLCDGGGYNGYDVEVIARMGADSFQPDSGVMISKVKYQDSAPFQWTIDANPQDIKLLDFRRPDGTPVMITMGDYRQLADALFHAGTNSGSQFEHVDKANNLHVYVVNILRSKDEVLSYEVGARLLNTTSVHTQGVKLADGEPMKIAKQTPTTTGVYCTFPLTNNGTLASNLPVVNGSSNANAEIYRLSTSVSGAGWKADLPNVLTSVSFGSSLSAYVSVAATENAVDVGTVTLTATSESDPRVKGTAKCSVPKDFNKAAAERLIRQS